MGYDLDITAEDVVLTHARAFDAHPSFRLVGGVDSEAERRDLFTARYGVPAEADLAAALSRLRPDVVVIAAPTPLHGTILETVLDWAAPRAILCEKPLSFDLDEARTMVNRCRDQGCPLFVNYLRRAAPGVREIKRRLATGLIATPVKGVTWYTKGLLHNGSHFADLLSFWLGPISGFTVIDPGRRWDGKDPEPDVRITFAAGPVTFLAAREEDYSLHEVDLIAPNGRLRYAQGGGRISWQGTVADPLVDGYTVLAGDEEDIPSGSAMTQWHVADQLAAGLAGGPAGLCDGSSALQTLEWLIEIRAAS